jgi:hypothetical protein
VTSSDPGDAAVLAETLRIDAHQHDRFRRLATASGP